MAKNLSQNATEYRAASKEEARQLGHGALADRQNEDEINEENKRLRNQKDTQETDDSQPKDTGHGGGLNQNPDAGSGDGDGEGSPDDTKEVPKDQGGGSGQNTGPGTGGAPVPERSGPYDFDKPGESGTHGQDTTKTVETVERNIRERAEGVNVEKTLDDSYKDNSLSDAEATRRQEEYKRKFYEQKSQEEEKYAKDNPEYPEDK